jgi:hypothetical protein
MNSPTVLSVRRVDPASTSASSVNFTVTFSEPVTGVNTNTPFADFELNTTGVTGAGITSVSGSGAVYTVAVNTGSGNGTIRLDVVDDDSIRDTGNNPLGGGGAGNGDFTSGEMYTILKLAHIDVTIAGNLQESYILQRSQSARDSYLRVNSGPVKIESTNLVPLMSAERVIYKVSNVPTSFSEMMALPNSQLDKIYWLPWYNSKELNTQLRFANVSTSTATVHVSIGGTPVPGSPFSIPAGKSIRKSYPGVDKGPVKIESDQDIVAAERVIYTVNGVDTSFSEMMALPASQVDQDYWLPWYNNKDLNTQIRIANVSGDTATVHISIAGTPVPGSPFSIPAGKSIRKSFPGIDKGPVQINSDVDIVAAERVIYTVNGVDTSFSEMMALPDKLLDTTYWLPWYNSKDLNTQLRIANVSGDTATVHVSIRGVAVPGSPFTILAGKSIRKSFPGFDKGPVRIVSDVDIVAAERVIYSVNNIPTSFSEMMALPTSLLDFTYWLPWYNNKDLETQLRFGVP